MPEVFYESEAREARTHAEQVQAVIDANPNLHGDLYPTIDFLWKLAWKGAGR